MLNVGKVSFSVIIALLTLHPGLQKKTTDSISSYPHTVGSLTSNNSSGWESEVIMGCCLREKTANIRAVSLHQQRSHSQLTAQIRARTKSYFFRSLFIRNAMQSTRKVAAAARASDMKIQFTSSFRGCWCCWLCQFFKKADTDTMISLENNLIHFKLGDNFKRLWMHI